MRPRWLMVSVCVLFVAVTVAFAPYLSGFAVLWLLAEIGRTIQAYPHSCAARMLAKIRSNTVARRVAVALALLLALALAAVPFLYFRWGFEIQ